MPSNREQTLYQWSCAQLKQPTLPWQTMAGDAGIRKYFRIPLEKTYLAVDSPIDAVDNLQFIALAKGMSQAGLHVPIIYAADLTQGFLLINELSTLHYADVLTKNNVDELYTDAMHALIKLHASAAYLPATVKPWNAAEFYAELTDMPVWLLEKHLRVKLSALEQRALEQAFAKLIENMQVQPQVMVHRDYHSRNLMYCTENNPGIIDFQDIFLGPITYDLVSLLRDAYVTWPLPRVNHWLEQFYTLSRQSFDYDQFVLWFHGMTLQRSIKVLGRFARLCYRDNKSRYLADIPQVANYALIATQHYPNMLILQDILSKYVLKPL